MLGALRKMSNMIYPCFTPCLNTVESFGLVWVARSFQQAVSYSMLQIFFSANDHLDMTLTWSCCKRYSKVLFLDGLKSWSPQLRVVSCKTKEHTRWKRIKQKRPISVLFVLSSRSVAVVWISRFIEGCIFPRRLFRLIRCCSSGPGLINSTIRSLFTQEWSLINAQPVNLKLATGHRSNFTSVALLALSSWFLILFWFTV